MPSATVSPPERRTRTSRASALGGMAWATSVGLLAYFLGTAAENAIKTIGIAGGALTLVSIVTFLLVLRARRRQRELEMEAEMETAPPAESQEAPKG